MVESSTVTAVGEGSSPFVPANLRIEWVPILRFTNSD